MTQRFALRALGMINALGQHKDEIKERLLAGDTSGMQPQADWLVERAVYVGAVASSLPTIPANLSHWDSRNSLLLLAAYLQIEAEVQAAIESFGPHRIGVVIGSSTSGIAEGEKAYAHFLQTGHFPPHFDYRQQMLGGVSAVLAALAGVQGPTYTVSTACTSSARAFGSARNLLAMGLCDAVLVGGADSLCQLTLQGFGVLGAISQGLSNPMSRHRDGINIGEGAALFLLTHLTSDDDICLWGVGESSDAHHISAPDPTGAGAERAIKGALADAGLLPQHIGYINLHGTATPLNDAMESKAVHSIFGDQVPCSSTKPLVGHTLGAAGATEAGFCWMVLQEQEDRAVKLPPHRWDGARDDAFPALQLATQESHFDKKKAPFCLSNSFAFGGNNCSVILGPAHAPITEKDPQGRIE